MKKYITIAALLAAGTAFANADTKEWTAVENVIPTLTSNTAATRIDFSTGNVLFGSGITAENVNSVLGNQNAGWYWGTNTNNSYGGWNPRENGFQAPYPKASGGEFCAFVSNALSSELVGEYSELKLSFDVGSVLHDTTNTGQTWTFSAWYKSEESLAKIGDVVSGSTANVYNKTHSWTFTKEDSSSFFENGGTLYLIVASSAGAYYQDFQVSNISLSGVAIPEPSAFGLLAGLGALALVGTRRRRK